MNKVELTKSVATRIGDTKKDANVYVDEVIEYIKRPFCKTLTFLPFLCKTVLS